MESNKCDSIMAKCDSIMAKCESGYSFSYHNTKQLHVCLWGISLTLALFTKEIVNIYMQSIQGI